MTLGELQAKVSNAIINSFPSYVWITAELGEIKEHGNGHCYLELVDYSLNDKVISAKAKGIIWNSNYKILKPFFETSTGYSLKEGMHLLLKVQVQYSAIYGLNLIVVDIDPSFTVGEMEVLRQKTIARLKSEGMFDMNSTLELPILPKRLAIISSETAAGYKDFMKHLNDNDYGFNFYTKLFPAPMQGSEAPAGIISALDSIAEKLNMERDCFDAVIIIRGGGASLDLSCFDDYDLAVNIAQFPIPVITGIGHEIDFHICDMVAHTWLKTPTAVADFILDIFSKEDAYMDSMSGRLVLALSLKIKEQEHILQRAMDRLRNACGDKINAESNKLDLYEMRLNSIIPEDILRRGFAIIYQDNKRIASVSDLSEDKAMELVLKDGIAHFVLSNLKIEIK